MDNNEDVMENDANGGGKKRGKGCIIAIVALIFLAGGGAATGYFAGTFALRQETPTEIEAMGADVAVRMLMIEPQFIDWPRPPSAKTAESFASGKELFAVQCATCHGLNGKGQGDFGKTMFPPAADLTSERTHSKTDGMLYWLIWHGVNYTGMPAFGLENGGGSSQEDIWSLVSHIRSLRDETPSE